MPRTIYKNTIHLVNEQTGQQVIKALGGEGFSADDIVNIFAHEYFHFTCNQYYTENQIVKKDIPKWLEEGMARYFEYEVNDAFPILGILDIDPILDTLVTPTQWEEYGESATGIHYTKAYMAVFHLVELKDKNVFRDIVNLLNGERTFDEAFKIAIGLSVREFEESKLRPF